MSLPSITRRTYAAWLACSALMAATGAASVANAQGTDFPKSPVTMIVGWPAGGPADNVARLVASQMSTALGQAIVIDNKGGAGGNIGSDLAARAKPDGYTIMLATSSSHGLNSALYDKLNHDPIKDFAPIGLVNTTSSVLLVPENSPFKTLKELMDFARKNPGKLTYGSGGVGSSQHLAGAAFKNRSQLDLLHVPFKGTAPAMTDLMAGRVDMIISTGSIPIIKSGKVRPLAITSKERIPALPNVPTFDEAGLKGFTTESWYGLVAPAGTPRPVLEKLNAALNKALENPGLRQQFIDSGSVPAQPMKIDAFWDMVVKGMPGAAELVRMSGAKAE